MSAGARTRRHEARVGHLSRPVFLVGFMGAGKTTVARRLSRMCGIACIDVDSYIERMADAPISVLFERDGEEAFRRIETAALADIARMEPPMVVSCGGGVVTVEENVHLMRETGCVVHLAVDADEAASRIADKSTRPLFQDVEAARARLQSRMPLYEGAADVTIDTAGRNAGAIAHEVRGYLQREGLLTYDFHKD